MFSSYIKLDCPDLYETTLRILKSNGELQNTLNKQLTKHVYRIKNTEDVSYVQLLEDLKELKCYEEYTNKIKDGKFSRFMRKNLSQSRYNTIIESFSYDKTLDVNTYLEPNVEFIDYHLLRNLKCNIYYILRYIVPREYIDSIIIKYSTLLNQMSNQCYTCGKTVMVDITFLLIYNGVTSKDILNILSENITKKTCCKRTLFDNINLIISPYIQTKPVTRKYIIEKDAFDDVDVKAPSRTVTNELKEYSGVENVIGMNSIFSL